MRTTFATIHTSRDFDVPVEALFAHWTSPETRVRWEAGPESGMVYDGFDTREGGVETVRIMHDGAEVGHMVQRIQRCEPGALLAVAIEGHFGGSVSMLMSVVVEFEETETETGRRINAASQVSDLTGRDVKAEHEAGWAMLLDKLAADIAEFGPVKPS